MASSESQTFDMELNIGNRSRRNKGLLWGHAAKPIVIRENSSSSGSYIKGISNKKNSDEFVTKNKNQDAVIITGRGNDEPPRMDWNDYHRLDVIHAFMDSLENDYPSICTCGSIGKSREGRDLKILKISNSVVGNASIWLDAGIHAREWIAPAVATYVANHIAKNFHSLPESITNKDWYILPVMNPDGYEYSHTTDRMWRKNRAWHKGQCVGVDLNRNFSVGYGLRGSSDCPTAQFFRGPGPFSEPESSAVRDMLSNPGIQFKVYITLHSYGQVILFPFAHKDDLCPDYVRLLEGATVMSRDILSSSGIHFKVYITLHSYGQVIMFPYAHTDQLCPDYLRLLEGATVMSRAIHNASGYIYKVGISRDLMNGAAGTSNDFSYGHCKVPFCYLIELRSKEHKFKVPKEEIEVSGREILSCVTALMEFVDTWACDQTSDGCGTD